MALEREEIYKGCTRPAMVYGVPIIPFVLFCGSSFLLLMLLFSIAWSSLSILVWWVMREICKEDDQRFNVLWVQWLTKMRHANARFWGSPFFQPVAYRRKRK